MYYDGLGNMAAQVMPARARPKYAGTQPTADEAKEALTGYLAYFGSYSVNERSHTITHHRSDRRTLKGTPPLALEPVVSRLG
jgi:lipocalin-like protein